MRRTEQAQGLRLMKFEEIYGRALRGVTRSRARLETASERPGPSTNAAYPA